MKLETLLKNKEFLAQISQAPDMKTILSMFEAEGVPVTEEELLDYVLPQGSELFEDDLEDVAGGSVNFGGLYNWLRRRLGLDGFSGGGGGHGF